MIDDVRTFISQNMTRSYNWYAERTGFARETLTRFVNDGRNARLDTVEMFLNELGYTLTVKPINTEDCVDAYCKGYYKGKADILEGLTQFIDEQRNDE